MALGDAGTDGGSTSGNLSEDLSLEDLSEDSGGTVMSRVPEPYRSFQPVFGNAL